MRYVFLILLLTIVVLLSSCTYVSTTTLTINGEEIDVGMVKKIKAGKADAEVKRKMTLSFLSKPST